MNIIFQLFHRAGTNNHRSNSFIFQHPCQSHLSESLTATSCNLIQKSSHIDFIICYLFYL